MAATYEARGRVYVTIEDRVSSSLLSFSAAVRDRLISVLTAESERLGTVARTQVSGHGTGKLAQSVKATKARAFRDVSVSAGVKMGGGRSTRHGHLFEHGFSGPEDVKAHRRKSLLGNQFDVRAYRRTVNYRAHGPLRGALNKRRDAIHQAVLDAISGAAQEKGLAP